jgi:hypothetical protein
LGRHRRQNPRGSPTGRKLAGDVLAEKVHGRKGMDRSRRKKGRSHVALAEAPPRREPLTRDQFQILWFLFTRGKTSHPGLPWDELVRELELLDVPEREADAFMVRLQERVDPWLVYIPGFGAYLNRDQIVGIGDALKSALRQFKD